MTQNRNTKSVTIDKRAVPLRRPTLSPRARSRRNAFQKDRGGQNKERRSVNALRRSRTTSRIRQRTQAEAAGPGADKKRLDTRLTAR